MNTEEFRDKVIENFIQNNNIGISKAVYDEGELTVYFHNTENEPWGIQEFKANSPTKIILQTLIDILD